MLCSCDVVNASTRPKGEYSCVTDALAVYEGGKEIADYQFIRDFGSLPKTPCDPSEFAGWEEETSEDGSSVTFTKDAVLGGFNTKISAGVRNENSKLIAVYMTFTDDGSGRLYDLCCSMWDILNDKTGRAYEAGVDGEKMSVKEARELLANEGNGHLFYGIWPRNSIKWSVMMKYENGTMILYFL